MKKFMVAVVALLSAVMVMFAQQDKTGTGGTTGYPPYGSGMHLFQRVIDFSNTSVNTGTASVVYQMLDIPAGTFILSAGYEVLENSAGTTGEDSTETIDIGDGSDPDGWIDGANVETGQTATAYCYWPSAVNTAVSIETVIGTVTNVMQLPVLEGGVTGAYTLIGKLYQATDTIDLKLNNDADTLKIRVTAVGIGAKKDW